MISSYRFWLYLGSVESILFSATMICVMYPLKRRQFLPVVC